MNNYQKDLDEAIEKDLEDDVYHHGLVRDTNNPNAIKPAVDILEECYGLVKPDEWLNKYVDRLFKETKNG